MGKIDVLSGWESLVQFLPAEYEALAAEHEQVETKYGNATSEAWLGGDAAGVYRGGPFLPVQSQSELLEFLAGLRCYGKDEEGFTPDVMARPALSL